MGPQPLEPPAPILDDKSPSSFFKSFWKVFSRLWKSCQNEFFDSFCRNLDKPDLMGTTHYGAGPLVSSSCFKDYQKTILTKISSPADAGDDTDPDPPRSFFFILIVF